MCWIDIFGVQTYTTTSIVTERWRTIIDNIILLLWLKDEEQ